MRVRALCVVMMLASSSAGCRQPDGPIPVIRAEVSDGLGDLTRDLVNASSGDRQSVTDLASHLSAFTEGAGEQEARELAARVGTAIAGSRLMEPSAQLLANQLWIAVAGRELSERQVDTLRNDVRGLLVSVGATEQNADAVAVAIVDVQQAVTSRGRRWYEWF